MSIISDAELLELESLLREEEIYQLNKNLQFPQEGRENPNYISLFNAITAQKYNSKGDLIEGLVGFILEGSSRSAKTWSSIFAIIFICKYLETSCKINIYREVYADFKDSLYDDFKRILDLFGLNNPFHTAQEVKSFKIGKNKITFLGCDKIGKTHGAGCDYAFFNEMIFIPHATFDQTEQRCRKFWWGDFNPSVTEHYIFDNILRRPDVGYLQSTFLTNPHISHVEKNKILGYEPWEPGSYDIIDKSEIWYNGRPIDKDNQPPPHPTNIENGTANVFNWKVYGLGLRGAMEGVIFDKVYWIDKMPDIATTGTIDFGFVNDPSAINRYAEDEYNIWIEPLVYKSTETPEEIDGAMLAHGFEKTMPITCDSSDKYTSEKRGAIEMVLSLRNFGWQTTKISKTYSVVFWILSMKKKKIHIVKNNLYHEIKKEKENYKWKEINGIHINQPEDSYNHFWDSARYGHMAYNTKLDPTTYWS